MFFFLKMSGTKLGKWSLLYFSSFRCVLHFNVVFLLCRSSPLIFDEFPSVLVCNPICFYAPPTIVEGHYVFWSVRPSVCPFVRSSVRLSVRSSVRLSRFRLKFLVKVVFDEVQVQSTSNLVHMSPMI